MSLFRHVARATFSTCAHVWKAETTSVTPEIARSFSQGLRLLVDPATNKIASSAEAGALLSSGNHEILKVASRPFQDKTLDIFRLVQETQKKPERIQKEEKPQTSKTNKRTKKVQIRSGISEGDFKTTLAQIAKYGEKETPFEVRVVSKVARQKLDRAFVDDIKGRIVDALDGHCVLQKLTWPNPSLCSLFFGPKK